MEVELDTTIPDTEAPFLSSPTERSNIATKSDDACFKEPQIMSEYRSYRHKLRNTSKPEHKVNLEPLYNIKEPSYLKENGEYGYSDLDLAPIYTPNAFGGTAKRPRVNLYTADNKPQMYIAKGNLVTPPIILRNLPNVFQYLPTTGKPGPDTTLEEFYRRKIRAYVGVTDSEFLLLEKYCSPEHLRTGKEIKMQTAVPVMGLLNSNILHDNYKLPYTIPDPPNLVTLKMNRYKMEKDNTGIFFKKLKYRGVRLLPCNAMESHIVEDSTISAPDVQPEQALDPGVDLLYRVRIYRPYAYNLAKDRYTRGRHSVFCCDVVLTGRHVLTALRDRFVCHNDFDLRVDVSSHPEMLQTVKAKEVFPSGFLFINNEFYVDTREGCVDFSASIREWALRKNLGNFPKNDMCQVRLDQLVLKLGYPEVFVHQGNCEHVFIFSEVRLLGADDPQWLSRYPCSSAVGQNQTVYCTTCAEFSAKWVVVGSERVPFDPGFLCATCFKLYMYKDGQKIGAFKAFRYRGNALNILKPL